MRRIICILFVLILFINVSAIVAGSPVTLTTVTVTAERFPADEKVAGRFVTVLTAETLKESGANNVVDALRRIGTLGYHAYAPLGISHGGMNSEIYIRGLRNGELILMNGLPIQDASGHGYDLNTIPIDLIERVEVLRGAASTLYGADAMTGVINIITKKPERTSKTKVSVEIGNESFHNHTASFCSPQLNIGLNYQHLGSQKKMSRSFSRNYGYRVDAMDKYSANLVFNPIDFLFFDFLGSYYESGFKKIYDNGKPFEGADQEHYKGFADVRVVLRNLKAKIFGTYDEMKRKEYTANDPEEKDKNYNFGLEGDYRFNLAGLQWVMGVDAIRRASDFSNQYGYHDRTDYGLFVQLKKTFFERLMLTFGFREQFIHGESGAKNYNRFLPSLDVVYKMTDYLNLFFNAGKAFRTPNFTNLYYESTFLMGNPYLGPEEGWTYEGGVKWDVEMVRLRFSGFYMTYEDKIEIDRSAGYPLTYFNAGDYDTQGIEWEIDLFPFVGQTGWLSDLSLTSGGFWTEPTAEDADGKEYQAGPKFQTSVGVSYSSEPIMLNANCRVLSSREKNLDDQMVVDFYGKCKIGKGFVTVALDNLFDEEVQVSGDIRASARNRYAYYGMGRLFKIGYEVTF